VNAEYVAHARALSTSLRRPCPSLPSSLPLCLPSSSTHNYPHLPLPSMPGPCTWGGEEWHGGRRRRKRWVSVPLPHTCHSVLCLLSILLHFVYHHTFWCILFAICTPEERSWASWHSSTCLDSFSASSDLLLDLCLFLCYCLPFSHTFLTSAPACHTPPLPVSPDLYSHACHLTTCLCLTLPPFSHLCTAFGCLHMCTSLTCPPPVWRSTWFYACS